METYSKDKNVRWLKNLRSKMSFQPSLQSSTDKNGITFLSVEGCRLTAERSFKLLNFFNQRTFLSFE